MTPPPRPTAPRGRANAPDACGHAPRGAARFKLTRDHPQFRVNAIVPCSMCVDRIIIITRISSGRRSAFSFASEQAPERRSPPCIRTIRPPSSLGALMHR